YFFKDTFEIASIDISHSFWRNSTSSGAFETLAQASNKAEAACSKFRYAISSSRYLEESTSPCSVILTPSPKVSTGWERILVFSEPPPRPREPPRPWK